MSSTQRKTSWLSIILLALLVCFLAGLFVNPLATDRIHALRSSSANNIRQIVLSSLVYANDHQGAWPKDLAELRHEYPELPPRTFHSPSEPTRPNTYCYVRPAPTATSEQPVLLEDPACEHGKGCLVGYADGHIAFSHDLRLWIQAQHLAALPKTMHQGVDGIDWGIQPMTSPLLTH